MRIPENMQNRRRSNTVFKGRIADMHIVSITKMIKIAIYQFTI